MVNNLYIKHSPFLFVPMFSDLVYVFQIFLLKFNLTDKILVSRKNNIYKDKLLELVSQQRPVVYLQTYKMGFIKELSGCEVCADFTISVNLKKMQLSELHAISGALLSAKYVSNQTRVSLGSFLPINYGKEN